MHTTLTSFMHEKECFFKEYIYLIVVKLCYFIKKKIQMANKHKIDAQISLVVNIYYRDFFCGKTNKRP